jgi:ABC-2 type transport system ATP-binding protein
MGVKEEKVSEEPAIDVFNLTHYYDGVPAVDRISFQVPSGSIFGLLGPNGAGKSTTIKMLTTLLPPTSGTATVSGFDIVQMPSSVRQNIGYVPQLLSADGDLSGYENLLLSGKLYGLSSQHREKRIYEVLDFMGLKSSADQLVNQYSGGMIRRLEIAQALLHRPKVLFLDEPTVGLDPSARQVLWHRIQVLRKQYGTTILITTHDMEEADLLCDTVAFMHLGHIVTMDSPATLKATLGAQATLNDVFMRYTGTSIKEGGSYSNVKQTRHAITHRG